MTVHVTKDGADPFKGFLVQARSKTDGPAGKFSLDDDQNSQIVDCDPKEVCEPCSCNVKLCQS